jgi:hypothetical protein
MYPPMHVNVGAGQLPSALHTLVAASHSECPVLQVKVAITPSAWRAVLPAPAAVAYDTTLLP